MRRTRGGGTLGRLTPWGLLPKRRWRISREGVAYLGVWIMLLVVGLHQQSNLILLIAGMAAGPIVSSVLISFTALRHIGVSRRTPPYVFEQEPLQIDYTLANQRQVNAVLTMKVEDLLAPEDRTIPGAASVLPAVTFYRVPALESLRLRWTGPTPVRGRYHFAPLELVTGAPFGLMERRLAVPADGEVIVYPRVGQLTRRWGQLHRESTQTKRGRRHDRTAQQQEYHGLREYRAGDSPRWIHWRTTARIGKPMVKEFEHQNDQDLAILVDPWLPRVKVTGEQREAIESALRFAATVCVESCKQAGRRILLGWTGPTPVVIQGVASTKLLHEFLGNLAIMRPATEGHVSGLLDILPPAVLRESLMVLVSTRPVNLMEEAERSSRLSGGAARGIAGRVIVLDSAQGDLNDLITFGQAADRPAPRR